ncbi:hypothetical protein CkaCkLH20_07944 [Colletotrichum karsti]|uniref:Alkaline proteinase n=1 Tax=Colletotrichum karsti TaxID=1095194 RepID=A0A9P6LIP2_9PEZI|nr:uncharacterized protein CkaCkLH20_07944 [Colletotrichum karsti]KAF9874381.1 hypothetical protein CkaCkLH20_07944 [Colletotrichum karsti]
MRQQLYYLVSGISVVLGHTLRTDNRAIPDKYIVSLKPGISSATVDSHLSWVRDVHKRRSLSARTIAGVEKTFDIGLFHAYAGSFDEEMVMEIEANQDVDRIEPDMPIYPFELISQTEATWGLGAISHEASINASANLRDGFEYRYDENGGEGTYAYVIDTGVWVDNPDFEGRAELGYTVYPDIPFEDSTGHGTHVAGTIASKTWGIAKKARVIAVKVIAPGQGVMSHFMEGFSWAVNNITATPGRAAVSVINMSLAGTASAITVAASAANNTVLSYSNFGSKVDLYAPGVDVYSLSLEAGKDVALTESGLESVEEVTARILDLCKAGVIVRVPEFTPNLFAFNGVGSELRRQK